MKIALVGATGNIGRQIARHALAHGHQVTAVVRSEKDLPAELAGAQLAIAALDDTAALAAVMICLGCLCASSSATNAAP